MKIFEEANTKLMGDVQIGMDLNFESADMPEAIDIEGMRATEEEVRAVRTESLNPTYRKNIAEKVGTVCALCGSDDKVEFHHILPVFLGGPNIPANIIPLCFACHKAVHCGEHVEKYRKISKEKGKGGRPRSCDPAVAEAAFDLYVAGKIGNKKCCQLIGYTTKNARAKGSLMYDEYMKKHGIVKCENRFDFFAMRFPWKIFDAKRVSFVVYEDGHTVDYPYCESTENDDVVYEYDDGTTMTWGLKKQLLSVKLHRPVVEVINVKPVTEIMDVLPVPIYEMKAEPESVHEEEVKPEPEPKPVVVSEQKEPVEHVFSKKYEMTAEEKNRDKMMDAVLRVTRERSRQFDEQRKTSEYAKKRQKMLDDVREKEARLKSLMEQDIEMPKKGRVFTFAQRKGA